MERKLVVSAGPLRSGSTWLYNAVRYAYLRAGYTVYAGFADAYDPETVAAVHVVKTHRFDAGLSDTADCVLTSRRDWYDVAASCVRVGYVPDEPGPVTEYLGGILNYYDSWRPYSDLEISYEEIAERPVGAVQSILRMLELEHVDACEVSRDVEMLRRCVVTVRDPVTQMWPRHVTDGRTGSYWETLSGETIEAVRQTIAKWEGAQTWIGKEN